MAFKFVALCAIIASVNAGYLAQEPQLAYAAAAPLTKVAHYSSAPAVSSVYSSISAPKALHYSQPALQTYAPVAKVATYSAPLTTYSAPIAKLATYSTPIVKSYSSAPAVSTVYNSYEHQQPLALAKSYSYAPAHLSYDSPAIGSTHQSTVRSFDGTVSHYGKAVDTAFTSVRKHDTRITNNVYAAAPAQQYYTAHHETPVIAAKTVSYAAPAQQYYTAHHEAPVAYAAQAHQVYTSHHETPVIAAKTVSYAAPAQQYYTAHHETPVIAAKTVSYAAPAQQYYTAHHEAPVAYAAQAHQVYSSHHETPVIAAKTLSYAHAAPVLAAKQVTYTSSPSVAHVSFDGHGAHYAW